MQKFLIIILILLISISCKKDEHLKDVSIINSWKLISITRTTDNQIIDVPQDLYYLTITFVDSITLKATSVCNPGTGTYTIKNDSIMISIGFTLMECQNDITFPNWDTWFISNLYQARKFNISDNNLTLYSDGDYNLNLILNQD